jgi:hypothetical protein
MELDYPQVRAQRVCPLCQGAKETGLVACWPCYRTYELRYGNAAAEQIIAQAEDRLLAQTTGLSEKPCP